MGKCFSNCKEDIIKITKLFDNVLSNDTPNYTPKCDLCVNNSSTHVIHHRLQKKQSVCQPCLNAFVL